MLKKDITILELLESEANAQHATDKLNRVDLVVKDEFGSLILIEIQNESQADYFHRMLYGASRLVTEHLNKGEAYGKIKKVIAIHIVYFDLGQGDDYIYHGTTQFVGIHKHDELQLSDKQKQFLKIEQVHEIYPEYYILKVQAFQDVIAENFDEWMYILKHGEIKENFKSKNIELVEEKLNVIKMDEQEHLIYHSYLDGLRYEKSMFEVNSEAKIQEGIQIGLEKGIELGEFNKALDAAQKIIDKGLSLEFASDVTSLSVDILKSHLKLN